MSGLLSLIARVMIAAIFLGSGVEKAVNAKKTIDTMAGVGIPYPNLLYFGALAFLFVGGVLVAIGLFTRVGALLLMVFLAMATYYFHPAWKDASQQIAFMKNAAIFGGLLMLFANGPGGWAVSGKRAVVVKKKD